MSAENLAKIAKARAIRARRRRQAARAHGARNRAKRRGGGFLAALAAGAALALSGCAAPQQHGAQAPILTTCGATIPERPIMPTEHLSQNATLDDFVKSAIAEIERREGYEQLLLQSLLFCNTGVKWK